MTKAEFDKLTFPSIYPVYVYVGEIFARKTNRTLLYGYTRDRQTWHVYLKDDLLHLYVYGNGYQHCVGFDVYGTSMQVLDLLPDKCLYPAACDYSFVNLLHSKGVNVRGLFTGWTGRDDMWEKSQPRQFYGEVYQENGDNLYG